MQYWPHSCCTETRGVSDREIIEFSGIGKIIRDLEEI
jgi:hypothetical protein